MTSVTAKPVKISHESIEVASASEQASVDTMLAPGELPDDDVAPSSTVKAKIRPTASDEEVVEPRKRKRNMGIMCIDLVEDQMRSRLVAVFALRKIIGPFRAQGVACGIENRPLEILSGLKSDTLK